PHDEEYVSGRGPSGQQPAVRPEVRKGPQERGEARLFVAGVLVAIGGLPAKGGGHRQDAEGEPGLAQMSPIKLQDPPPLGVEVDLREQAQDVRAEGSSRREELELGGRVFL